MNDAQKWLDKVLEEMQFIEQSMYEDAKTLSTYGKAKKYVKNFKHDFSGSYTATPEEQVQSAFNSMIDDVIKKLNLDSDKAVINHDRK